MDAEPDNGRRCFIAAADLTTQAGTVMQQDLTLSTTLGNADVERNCHQYGEGMSVASAEERAAFAVGLRDMMSHSPLASAPES